MIYGLAERLAERREACGLSQRKAAHLTGVTPATISNYEKGEITPSLKVLMKLATLYRCSLDYLVFGDRNGKGTPVEMSLLTDEESAALREFLLLVKSENS